MTLTPQKLAVLQLLRSQQTPLTMPQILKLLGPIYVERTVRRWLQEYITKGYVQKNGEKRGARYIALLTESAIDNSRSSEAISAELHQQSAEAIQALQRPIFQRKPVSYNESWINHYEPNVTSYLPEEIVKQLKSMGSRIEPVVPAGTYARRIYNRLVIDLSYNSSRLEGNTYSLLETTKLLLEGEEQEGKLDEEKIMILNHKEAIRYIVEMSPKLVIDEDTICTIHYLLSDGLIEPKYSGVLRDHSVRVSGTTYLPTDSIGKLQKWFHQICRKASLINEPFEQSFFLLVHLSYLQAFADVNKRTARLSCNIPLIIHNLVPLSFNDVDKAEYITAIIAIYELNNISPLLEVYFNSYVRTSHLYSATVEAIGLDTIRVQYRQLRRDSIREIIVKSLFGDNIKKFLKQQAKKIVKVSDQELFIEDVEEDLARMNVARISGLGITKQQLQAWLNARGKK